jgi:hypothetical protein
MTATKAKPKPKPKPKPKRKAPVPKHKLALTHTWNHRVVRRYDKECSWLELTEVHYRNGEPLAFAIKLGPPFAVLSNDIEN